MSTLTSQLVIELLDRVTSPARRAANALSGISNTIRETNSRPILLGERLDAAITRNNRAIDAARGRMFDALGTLYVLKEALSAPVQAAQEFDRALAEIGAKGDLSAGQLRGIGQAARQTAAQMNQFATDVVKAQDFLVGMGLDVERATRAMPSIARAATATGASLEDLSKAGFAAMSNLGIAAQDLARSFDTMAAAGKAGGFELRDMAQYLPSITALASSKGMTGSAGLAQITSALQIVRRGAGDASEAATNFNNILQKINSNDAIKNFRKAGIDIQQVLKQAKANGSDPLEASLRAIDTAIGGDLSRIGELFADAQVQKGLIPLLNGLEDYLKLRDQASGASGVIDADFARMMQTSVEQMKAFRIAVQNLQTGIGTALIAVLGQIAGSLRPVLEALTGIVSRYPQVTGALVAMTAGFVGLKAAIAGLSFIGLMGRGGMLASLSFAVNTLGAAMARLKTGATGMIALQSALAGMQGAQMTGLQTAAAALRGMALAVPGVSGLATAMTAVGGALAAISAPVWGGIAIAVGAVAAAAYSLWRYWDHISSVLSGAGQAVSELLAPALERIRPLLDWLAPIGGVIASGWERAKTAIASVADWLGSVFSRETLSDNQKQQARQAGYDFVMSLWNGMKQVFDRLIAWIMDKASAILAPVRGLASTVGGLFGSTGSRTSTRGSGGAPAAVDGERATGGPISRGSTYMVGERGPELITAGRSGYVNKAGSVGAGGITVSPVFNMTFHGKTDAEDVVQQIRRVLRDEVRETFRGVFADTSMRFV